MKQFTALLLAMICFSVSSLSAQEREDNKLVNFGQEQQDAAPLEVDTTLFRIPRSALKYDPYSQATRYYRAQGSSRRRGLYYTTAEQIIEPSQEYLTTLSEPLTLSRIALYSAQSRYRIGLRANHARRLNQRWNLESSLWAQTGRDMFIEGVFSNSINPEIRLSRAFDVDHFLTLNLATVHSTQGLQYGSTPEAFSLVGNNYYNPSWGFYNNKVRNARVRRVSNPTLELHYQRPLTSHSTLVVKGLAQYDRTATSSIGWYNATTPSPDYYRKMPSFMSEGQVRDFVTNIWRTNDTDYTQINWDDLARLNYLSPDGNAYYTVEDRVSREINGSLKAIVHSQLSPNLAFTYGATAQSSTTRNFKKMRDLLGADHLVDYDVFIDENYNKTLPLQNNLLDPDNKVTEGERFGYDYSIHRSTFEALLIAQYRISNLDLSLEATIGSESFHRTGHFEKERFAGAASLGNSATIQSSPYMLRAGVSYAIAANTHLAVKLLSSQLSPQSRNLFLSESSANYLAPTTSGERINSAALSLQIESSSSSLSCELYAMQSRNGSSLYALYDDLSSTMCRASITQIGFLSYGAEIVASSQVGRDLRLEATLVASRCYYDTDPYIELISDYSLTTISEPISSRMSGITLGNTPQLTSTLSASYFGLSKHILRFSSSYAGERYIQPSIARRSERFLSQAFLSYEAASAALEQQRLGDIFDIEISAIRFIWFDNDTRLMLQCTVRNLLGQSDRVVYAKESDRAILQSVDGYFTGAAMREGLYQYGAPRTILFSLSYQF